MMPIYVVPYWFFQLSVFLEVLFAVAAGIIAYYSFKVYKLSNQRTSLLFTFGFFFIALSYLIKSAVILFLLGEAKEGIRELSFQGLTLIGEVGFYANILLFILGLVTLTYMTTKKKNFLLYALLTALSFLVVLHNVDAIFLFNILSTLFLLYLCIHYGMEYSENQNKKTLLVLIAFVFLLLSGLGFVVAYDYYLNFVIGHMFELAAYILIIASLVLTIRKK